MRIIRPMVIVEDDLSMVMPNGFTLAQHMLKKIEWFARKCYKSEGRMTDYSYMEFVPRLFHTNKHEGIIEHRFVSVTFITDRGVSHEGVRHRMASYLQESTRYCDYGNKGVTFILPQWVSDIAPVEFGLFLDHCRVAEHAYQFWRKQMGWTPQQARYFLPNGIKTEYAATLNFGSWYNFFRKRTAANAHPQMRQVAIPLLRHFQRHLPEIYGRLEIPPFDGPEATVVVNPYYGDVPWEVVYEG